MFGLCGHWDLRRMLSTPLVNRFGFCNIGLLVHGISFVFLWLPLTGSIINLFADLLGFSPPSCWRKMVGEMRLEIFGGLVGFAWVDTGPSSFIPREDLTPWESRWRLERENVAPPNLQRQAESSRRWSQEMNRQCGHGGQAVCWLNPGPPGGVFFIFKILSINFFIGV